MMVFTRGDKDELVIKFVIDAKGTTRLELTSPFNQRMVAHCRKLGGHWNKTARHWYFNESAYTDLKDACYSVYGQQARIEYSEQLVDISGDLETALQYVSGIKALADHLDTNQRNEVLMALLEALS